MRPLAQVNAQRGRRRFLLRGLLSGGVTVLVLSALYFATLLRPQLFFSFERSGATIQVYSDEPIPESAARIIALAEARIQRSPLFDATRKYPVYVCNSRWRWNYMSAFDGYSRGFETPRGRAVFIRPARWDTNQLAGPDGRDGPRPLDVYIAHEVTHMMVGDYLGLIGGWRLPVWFREGYAEYVARQDSFDYAATRARLITGDKPVGVRDQYWKYLLLVTHLLDKEGRDVRAVLDSIPGPQEVEARVRLDPIVDGSAR